MKKKIKAVIKKFVEYTIEDDYRIYRWKHTPLKIKRSLTASFLKEYGSLSVVPGKIVCDNYMGNGYGCNGKYVTEILLKSNKNYDIVWAVREKEKRKNDFPKGIRLVEYGSKEAMYEYATAAVWLCNYHLIYYFNRGLMKKKGQTYIQMWHGSFGIKKIENDCTILNSNQSWTYLAKKNAASTDYWISNSRFETEVYKSAFWGAGRILEYGHPRNDIFFVQDTLSIRKHVETALGIDETTKLLLYVPTFRESGRPKSDQIDVSRVLQTLEEKESGRWVFAVRFHPRIKENEQNTFQEKWNGIINVSDYPDIQELLLRADTVLTDYSSCVFDYLLQKKMAFLFVPDQDAYLMERGFYYPLKETPFPIAGTNEELCDNIRNFDMSVYKDRIESFLKKKGSAENGEAAQKTADLVMEFLDYPVSKRIVRC